MTRRPIPKGLRFDVLNRDGFKCRYCGESSDTTQLHIDHVIPVALGGTNAIDNLATACVACNIGKSAKMADVDADLDYDGVYCPFADGWPNDIEDPVYWMNSDWAVTEYGLECLTHFYALDSHRLLECHRDHETGVLVSAWLNHMPSKTWVARNPNAFLAAFLKAIRAHGLTPQWDSQASLKLFRGHIRRIDPYLNLNARMVTENQEDEF